MDLLLPVVEQTFKATLLSTKLTQMLLDLQNRAQFAVVKEWILNCGVRGFALGVAPEVQGADTANDEITDIVFSLINMGLLLQNGHFYYYLTSYFHFLEFLRPFRSPFEAFLREILVNKFFRLMCGHRAGFGCTFETIVVAALFSHPPLEKVAGNAELIVPIALARLRTLTLVRGQPSWENFTWESDVVYHLPDARAVDLGIMQDHRVVLVQVTTAQPPDVTKLEALAAEVKVVARSLALEGIAPKVQGWVVSLFPYPAQVPSRREYVITAGDALAPLLGRELYERLRCIKCTL